jgi:hypothetical protein
MELSKPQGPLSGQSEHDSRSMLKAPCAQAVVGNNRSESGEILQGLSVSAVTLMNNGRRLAGYDASKGGHRGCAKC